MTAMGKWFLLAVAMFLCDASCVARTVPKIIGDIQNDVQGCGEDFDVDESLNIRTTWHTYNGSPGFNEYIFNAYNIDSSDLTKVTCKKVGCVTKTFKSSDTDGTGVSTIRPTRESEFWFSLGCSDDMTRQDLVVLWDELITKISR